MSCDCVSADSGVYSIEGLQNQTTQSETIINIELNHLFQVGPSKQVFDSDYTCLISSGATSPTVYGVGGPPGGAVGSPGQKRSVSGTGNTLKVNTDTAVADMRNMSVTNSPLLEIYRRLLQRWLTSPVRRLSQGKADGQKKPPIRTRRRDNRSEQTTPLTGNAQVVQKCKRAVYLNVTCNECRPMMSNGETADGFETKGTEHLHLKESLKMGEFCHPAEMKQSCQSQTPSNGTQLQTSDIWRRHMQIFS